MRVDISLPLYRGHVLSIEDEEEHWVTFKYECLPNICYWIRAALTSMSRKPVVVVSGFFENREQRMPTSARPVVEESSPSSKGHRADVTKVGQPKDTVSAETEEHVTKAIIAPGSSILQTANGGNHRIKGDFIDSRLLEIDRILNKGEIIGSEKRGVTTNNKEAGLDIPNKDKEEKNKPSSSEGSSKTTMNGNELDKSN